MSVPFNPTRNATAGSTAAPTTSNLTTTGQCAINAYTGTYYMRKEDATISDIVGDRLSGFRNRLINGNMAIDQRNAGASVTPSATYTLDRWKGYSSQSSKYTVQKNAGSVTPPVGFKNYLGATSSSAYSVGAVELFLISQIAEGYNVSDLEWGAAGASPVTVSFWVRSSLTGTFGGSVTNGAQNYSYPFSYSISSANAWEYKTITIVGPTSGTWTSDNSASLSLFFSLGAGSSYSGTAGSWAAGAYYSTTGATSVVGTSGATLYITGVQLEKGLVPTPFEVRSYGTELALCQRYFSKSFDANVAPANGLGSGLSSNFSAYDANSGQAPVIAFPVNMRSAPTITYYQSSGSGSTAGQWGTYDAGWTSLTTSSTAVSNTVSFTFVGTRSLAFVAKTTLLIAGHWTANSEL